MALAAPWCVRSSWIRDRAVSPALAGGFLTTGPPGKPGMQWEAISFQLKKINLKKVRKKLGELNKVNLMLLKTNKQTKKTASRQPGWRDLTDRWRRHRENSSRSDYWMPPRDFQFTSSKFKWKCLNYLSRGRGVLGHCSCVYVLSSCPPG